MYHDYGYFEEKRLDKPYDVKMIKWLYPFVKSYRLFFIISVLLVVFITLLDLSIPYVTKIAIDRYIVPGINSGINSAGDAVNTSKKNIRRLHTDLSDSKIRAIINKYPELFKVNEKSASISFEDLSKLEKKDIIILRKNDLKGIGVIAALFLSIIIANFTLNFFQIMIMEYTGQMIMHDLRVKLFSHIQSLSVTFFVRNPVGRLVTRVTNDVQNMHELFTSVITFVFKDLFLVFGIALVLLGINWKLALVSFAVVPVVVYISIHFSGLARDIFRSLRIKTAQINTSISETIGGIKVIQLFRQEKKNYRNFERLNHEYYMTGMEQIRVFAIFMPAIEFLGVIAVAAVIFYGGSGVLAESISLGALVAFISYIKMFFMPIRDIAEKYSIMQNAMASAERIFLIFDSADKLPQVTDCSKTGTESKTLTLKNIKKIAIEDLSFGYDANKTVLKKISFVIHAGETIAVVGPTGSGKTSLVNLIIRFYDPTSGRILINGQDIRTLSLSALRSKTALVVQDPFLFSGTIRDNIFRGKQDFSEKEALNIIKISNCRNLIDRLPDGLDSVLSEGGASISSGERQLLSIARAFAHDPDVIILDEATSYIDSETEQKIQGALSSLMKNRTSIIIAHRLSTVRTADRIYVLNRGRIIETGNHNQLMKSKGFYFKLHQFQNNFVK